MKNMPIVLTEHAKKRISKRFGIHSKEGVKKYAENVVKNGTIISSNSNITITYLGHSFIFIKTENSVSKEAILLMITACNDDKSSEWTSFHNGKICKCVAVKRSKINQGKPVKKYSKENKYTNNYYNLVGCA